MLSIVCASVELAPYLKGLLSGNESSSNQGLVAIAALWAIPAHAGLPYEESLKQLAEGVITDAVKAKRERLAVLDFTNAKAQSHR